MEQTVVCLVLVLLSLATVWGQMEIPCIAICGQSTAAADAAVGGNAAAAAPGGSSQDTLCCPAGFSRTVVKDKCTCSIPLPSFLGATGTPDLSGLSMAQLFQYQTELLDYIKRLVPALPPTPAAATAASEKSPKFVPGV